LDWGNEQEKLPYRAQASHVMNVTLSKALVALLAAGILFVGSVLLFLRERTLGSFLQPLGAGCLVVVILTHIFEALHLLPWMRWGSNHSVGHYLDLGSAVLGLTLFPIGYLLHALTKRHA
jgi:Ca2+/Na+ antiporter